MKRLEQARILMYSHDTFGLGHLMRCRAIAHALVERYKGLFVLILTGSPIAGTFNFRARVDFVKIPSVIKLYNGQYTSIDKHIDLHDTLKIRKAIIRHTAASFEPDLMIVDKEPLGLEGEMEETLRMLKQRGSTLVLGLRDVMDSPELLRQQWSAGQVLEKTNELYDKIWIYGTRDFWHPLTDLDVPEELERKATFTGYLRRQLPALPSPPAHSFTNPYVLVTVGGGGDGADLIDWVLRAYEHDHTLPHPALLVLGPFMQTQERDEIRQRASALEKIEVIDFESNMEHLMTGAIGVVAMGGYNTYCEILSFDKRALIYPRVQPRKEQLIRAKRAAELGLVGMLHPDQSDDPNIMAQALRDLPLRLLPSEVEHPGLLDGLETVSDIVGDLLSTGERPALSVVESNA